MNAKRFATTPCDTVVPSSRHSTLSFQKEGGYPEDGPRGKTLSGSPHGACNRMSPHAATKPPWHWMEKLSPAYVAGRDNNDYKSCLLRNT